MSKVSIIGAGNVGATCANAIAHLKFSSDVVLLDIKPGIAEGKALDMMQTAKLLNFYTRIDGVTDDYKATSGSDVVVITSGIPRKPGMTREELIGTNANIVKSVVDNVLKYSPEAIIVIVSNPMDTMTYLTLKSSKLPKNRVIGMGGILDSSRFTEYLSEAIGAPATDINGMVIGGHGDTTMIPLINRANYNGILANEILDIDKATEVVSKTMVGGATLTQKLGTSAWYAPGAAVAKLVQSIILDAKKVYPNCVYLDGEYGQKDICIGVPVVIGRNGVEKIIEIELDATEKALFEKSCDAVRSTNQVLKDMSII